MVYAKCTIFSVTVLDAPGGALGVVGQVESHFNPFGDIVCVRQDRCTVNTKRTIGSEIILDEPDRTPRL
jgi:hypothetical protein